MIINKFRHIVFFMLLMTEISSAISGTADLELTMEFDIPKFVNFGDTGEFSITITNNGPDDAGLDSPFLFPIIANTSAIETSSELMPAVSFSQILVEQECFFIASIAEPLPGQYPTFNYEFDYPIIPVNTSFTCFGQYHIGFSEGVETINWSIFNFLDTDPNPNNNSVDMVFGIQPPIVPSLSWWSTMIMILILGLFGFHRVNVSLQQS